MNTLTNTDNPNFNHLGGANKQAFKSQAAYNTAPQTYNAASQAYSQYTPVQAQTYTTPQAYALPSQVQQQYNSPLRFQYQYYPANQYLSYLQNPQIAAQLGQYSLQQSAAPHYLQTPTQIQYVSPPNYQQVPSAQFKALTSKSPVATTSTSSETQASTPLQSTSQVLLPSNTAGAHVQYQQPQQYVMYLVSPQHQQALLAQQQQQALYYPGQQMLLVGGQNPLLSLYSGQHRFSLPLQSAYASPAATQVS